MTQCNNSLAVPLAVYLGGFQQVGLIAAPSLALEDLLGSQLVLPDPCMKLQDLLLLPGSTKR